MPNRNPIDLFIAGARKGWTISINSIIPNLVMAYAITEVLKILGVLTWLGIVFSPIMGFFNLPGEAITVLFTSWLSSSAGAGVAASLYKSGVLSNPQVTILVVAIFLMGAQLQYMGRLLGVAEVPKRYWPMLCINSITNALIAMFIMKFVV